MDQWLRPYIDISPPRHHCHIFSNTDAGASDIKQRTEHRRKSRHRRRGSSSSIAYHRRAVLVRPQTPQSEGQQRKAAASAGTRVRTPPGSMVSGYDVPPPRQRLHRALAGDRDDDDRGRRRSAPVGELAVAQALLGARERRVHGIQERVACGRDPACRSAKQSPQGVGGSVLPG